MLRVLDFNSLPRSSLANNYFSVNLILIFTYRKREMSSRYKVELEKSRIRYFSRYAISLFILTIFSLSDIFSEIIIVINRE